MRIFHPGWANTIGTVVFYNTGANDPTLVAHQTRHVRQDHWLGTSFVPFYYWLGGIIALSGGAGRLMVQRTLMTWAIAALLTGCPDAYLTHSGPVTDATGGPLSAVSVTLLEVYSDRELPRAADVTGVDGQYVVGMSVPFNGDRPGSPRYELLAEREGFAPTRLLLGATLDGAFPQDPGGQTPIVLERLP